MPPSPPGGDGVITSRAGDAASGKPPAMDLAGGDIRRDAHLLHGEQGTGAARALDLGDKRNAVLVAQGAQALHEAREAAPEPAFTAAPMMAAISSGAASFLKMRWMLAIASSSLTPCSAHG